MSLIVDFLIAGEDSFVGLFSIFERITKYFRLKFKRKIKIFFLSIKKSHKFTGVFSEWIVETKKSGRMRSPPIKLSILIFMILCLRQKECVINVMKNGSSATKKNRNSIDFKYDFMASYLRKNISVPVVMNILSFYSGLLHAIQSSDNKMSKEISFAMEN